MPPRIDVYINSLVRFSASAVVLASDESVALRFPSGQRFANQRVAHDDLLTMLEQVAPPMTMGELLSGSPASFAYEHDGKGYEVKVEPSARAWRVVIEPGGEKGGKAPAAAREPERRAERAPEREPAPPPARAPTATAPTATAPRPRGDHSPIDQMLITMKERGASDLHLTAGQAPMVRLHGEIQRLGDEFRAVDAQAMMELLRPMIPEKNRAEFEERNDTDFAHAIEGVSRFRVNMFRDRSGPGAVMRAIPFEILSPEQIGIPPKVLDLCFLTKGLVVVTGPTGSGKSTTLATLVDHINRERKDHIITIEDPIEFVHQNKGCLVNQREVHTHTRSFKDALRAALREDPDIVLVGEMRDLETIAIAVETAETGHLVFGTLHTTTAPSTVDRIIDQFPADRQDQIRQMLAESLRGVIAQTLCRKIGGGRVAAYEILLGSSAVSNMIRERKTFQLLSLMQTGRAQGMITLNDSLLDLVKRKMIEPREAYLRSVNKVELAGQLKREGFAVDGN